jgi:hypothetical protein
VASYAFRVEGAGRDKFKDPSVWGLLSQAMKDTLGNLLSALVEAEKGLDQR